MPAALRATPMPPVHEHPTRIRRLGAAVIDWGTLVLAIAVAAALASAWLLVRSNAGRVDVGVEDSLLAASLIAAAPPTWLAWLASLELRSGTSPGQRLTGLAVAGSPRGRLVRLALHPITAPGWLWLAGLAAVLGYDEVAGALLVPPVLLLAAGLFSLAAVVSGRSRPFHDLVASTRVERAPAAAAGTHG